MKKKKVAVVRLIAKTVDLKSLPFRSASSSLAEGTTYLILIYLL